MKDKAGPYSIGSDVWPGLAKLTEECGELIQVLGKIVAMGGDVDQHHWDGSDLVGRLVCELGDVAAAVAFFSEMNGLPTDKIESRADEKVEKFCQWHKEQQAVKNG